MFHYSIKTIVLLPVYPIQLRILQELLLLLMLFHPMRVQLFSQVKSQMILKTSIIQTANLFFLVVSHSFFPFFQKFSAKFLLFFLSLSQKIRNLTFSFQFRDFIAQNRNRKTFVYNQHFLDKPFFNKLCAYFLPFTSRISFPR